MSEPRVPDRVRALQKVSTDIILANTADPRVDISNERKKATFNVADLSIFLYDSQEKIDRRHEIVEGLKADPRFRKDDFYFLTRTERYVRGIQIMPAIRDLVFSKGYTRDEGEFAYRMFDSNTALDLHFAMFLPTILGQGTREQSAQWGMEAAELHIIGNYAQSELGHGTYLRGLETTATYDKSTQEFILHSPTLTAYKWWPGTLGKSSTHSVVVARLFIDGKDYGPYPFLIQIRDLETHLALPGVVVGDIGPKMGFTAIDNGFLGLDHVRVPRNAMLMKNAQVTPDGKFVAPKVQKSSYGTMILIRAQLVGSASFSLSKAVTIATRFGAVRRQTAPEDGGMELQVIDYQNQQRQLFPLIATAYAFHFTGKVVLSLYYKSVHEIEAGDFGALPELHAVSAGLKAICTWITAESIEKCRLLCGGHGYSLFSGLPTLYADYVAACTYEGENNVMCLQTARYLLKAWRGAKEQKALVGYLRYLIKWSFHDKFQARTEGDLRSSDYQLDAFAHRAGLLLKIAAENVDRHIASGVSEAAARDAAGSDLVAASRAHCMYVILSTFTEGLSALPQTSPLLPVLARLRALFVYNEVEAHLGEFLLDGFMNHAQVVAIHSLLEKLLLEIRPDAVALVDAFDHDDYALNSALGRYDGDVYKTLFDWAQNEPLNKQAVGPGYEEFIRPLLKSKL